jgi:hypothetical protein
MDYKTLAVVVGLPLLMHGLKRAIESLMDAKGATDVYVLSNSDGQSVDVVLNRQASDAERAAIIDSKVRELTQRQTA